MKLISLVAFLSFLFFTPLRAESPLNPKGNAKITKNEAEHIALKEYPGARVTAGKLETVRGQLVWSLQVAVAGSSTKAVAVDAMTGHIIPAEKQK